MDDDRDPRKDLPASIALWNRFLNIARYRRLDADKFASYLPYHFEQHPLPPIIIADALLRPSERQSYRLDTRFMLYLNALLKQRRVDAPSVLRALYKYSTLHLWAPSRDVAAAAGGALPGEEAPGKQEQKKIVRWRNSWADEETIIWRLAKLVHKGQGITTAKRVFQVSSVLVAWMRLFAEAAPAFSRDGFGPLHDPHDQDDAELARNAFVLFLIAFSRCARVRSTLSRPACKGICKALSDALKAFLPCVIQGLPVLVDHLEKFRTKVLSKYLPAEKKDAAEVNTYMDSLIGLDNVQVPEVPIVNSRAGLYIFLSAALVGRPMLDDASLFTYLQNRYQGDVHLAGVQLILASFDLLANAVFRNEGPKAGHLLKSYVVNKVPLILVSLSTMSAMYPFNAELCITEALGQVDTNIFPTLSGMFDMSNTSSSFHDSVRQDFCFSCQLHGLLSPAATENLLGDITYQSLPDEGRYSKEILVQSCLQDVDRTQKLIGELENMNGNVGAAAQAIVEVIGSLCRDKETMTLKHLCSQLAAKPLSLDVLLLFDKPQKILHPLCELLDNWAGYEEDQGEYQPVYEEFGSILILLLAFSYRYKLSPRDLGIHSSDSFLGKLLGGGNLCRSQEELNEQEKSHLDGWIHGLFDTEAGGLGDELMASCPPQDFYLLVPTLFNRIVTALNAGYLTDDVLKGGLEYLVGVLLLPALVPAILYLSNQLWVGGSHFHAAIIKILQVIIRPSSISDEAATMLPSVLNIVAKPLEHALRSYQRQDPKCQEVEPLLRAIKENLARSRRTGGANHTELESWCGAHTTNSGNSSHSAVIHGGLSAAVRHTIQSVIQWAQHPPLNGMPATYTHRQTLAATKMLGAKRHLSILLDEVKPLADTPQAGIAYDVATAIVCAPDVTNDPSLARPLPTAAAVAGGQPTPLPEDDPAPQQRRTSLREALKAEADDWKRIQKSDRLLAEAVVRLHRRVEAQTAPPPPPLPLPLPLPDQVDAEAVAAVALLHGSEMGGLGDAAALAESMSAADLGHVHDGMVMDTSGLDASDLGLGGDTGHVDLGGDNIFGGEFGADFSSWDMDLS